MLYINAVQSVIKAVIVALTPMENVPIYLTSGLFTVD